jgi:hypothetical protein
MQGLVQLKTLPLLAHGVSVLRLARVAVVGDGLLGFRVGCELTLLDDLDDVVDDLWAVDVEISFHPEAVVAVAMLRLGVLALRYIVVNAAVCAEVAIRCARSRKELLARIIHAYFSLRALRERAACAHNPRLLFTARHPAAHSGFG